MTIDYEYKLLVVQSSETVFRAYLGEEDSPLQGSGESPLQAIAALCEAIREWPIGGADRWLKTNAGKALKNAFVEDPFQQNRGKSDEEKPS